VKQNTISHLKITVIHLFQLNKCNYFVSIYEDGVFSGLKLLFFYYFENSLKKVIT